MHDRAWIEVNLDTKSLEVRIIGTGIEFLKNLLVDKEVQVRVVDIRTNMIESPKKIAERIRRVLEHVPAEQVTLSTDCGMKPLSRIVARMKLKALTGGAQIVRDEIS